MSLFERFLGRRRARFPVALPKEKREKLLALAEEGLSEAEVAEELGVSERTVRRYLQKGKGKEKGTSTLREVLEEEKVKALKAAFNDPEVARKYQERLLDSILPPAPDTGNLAIRPEDEEDDLEVLERQVEGLRRLKELSAEFGPQGSGWSEGLRALAQILSSPNLAYLVGQKQLPSPVSPPPAPLAQPQAPSLGLGAGGVGAISPQAGEEPLPEDLQSLLAKLRELPPAEVADFLGNAAGRDPILGEWLSEVMALLQGQSP